MFTQVHRCLLFVHLSDDDHNFFDDDDDDDVTFG